MAIWIFFSFILGFMPGFMLSALGSALLSLERGNIAKVAVVGGIVGGALGAIIIGLSVTPPPGLEGPGHD